MVEYKVVPEENLDGKDCLTRYRDHLVKKLRVHCYNFINYKTEVIDKIEENDQAQLKYPADVLFIKMELDCEKYMLETVYDDERKEGDSDSYLIEATRLKKKYSKYYEAMLKHMKDTSTLNSVPLGLIMNYAVFLYELADIEGKLKHRENTDEAIRVL